jgi:hypothetical protein
LKTRKKIRKELNNYELSRTKDLIQKIPETQENQLNYPNFQETQTRLLKDSAKTKKKSDFFFVRQQSRFQDQASFYIYIYIYIFQQEQNKIKNLGVYADFD